MNEKKFNTQDEAKDNLFGNKGTFQRDYYESELNLFLIGEVIRRTRIEKNLSQTALGKLVGVNKTYISRIEHGLNVKRETIAKIFKALEIKGGWRLRSLFSVMD